MHLPSTDVRTALETHRHAVQVTTPPGRWARSRRRSVAAARRKAAVAGAQAFLDQLHGVVLSHRIALDAPSGPADRGDVKRARAQVRQLFAHDKERQRLPSLLSDSRAARPEFREDLAHVVARLQHVALAWSESQQAARRDRVGVAVVAVLTALAVGVLSVEVVGETVGQPAGAVVGWSVAGAAWLLLVHLFAPAVESWRARRSARRTVRLLDAARDALRTLQNDRTRVLEDDVWSRGWT